MYVLLYDLRDIHNSGLLKHLAATVLAPAIVQRTVLGTHAFDRSRWHASYPI